jgi:hypothetical protein
VRSTEMTIRQGSITVEMWSHSPLVGVACAGASA